MANFRPAPNSLALPLSMNRNGALILDVDAAVLHRFDAGRELDELAGGGFWFGVGASLNVFHAPCPVSLSRSVRAMVLASASACSRVSTSGRRRRLGRSSQ